MTEYTELKRFLFNVKDVSSRINGAEVNKMIADANRAAYAALDERDKAVIRDAVLRLQVNCKQPFGDTMALELLAAVGDYLNGNYGKNSNLTLNKFSGK